MKTNTNLLKKVDLLNFLIFWSIGIWWLSKPFLSAGYHDGLLYTADAIRHLYPENFSKDIFFHEATQGNYTIFPWIYGKIILQLGIEPAALTIVTIGRLLWVAALIILINTLNLSRDHKSIAIAAALLLPAGYSYGLFFLYGEANATPRCWAEAFGMLALASWFGNKKIGAWIFCCCAFLFHPLMALPIATLITFLHSRRIRVSIFSIAIAVIFAAAIAGIPPFSGLMLNFDEDWLPIIRSRNVFLFIQKWDPEWQLRPFIFMILLGFISKKHENIKIQALARALLATLVLCSSAWLFACFDNNVLLNQLQLWRVLWITQLLTPALWLTSLRPWRTWDKLDWAHFLGVIVALQGAIWALSIMLLPALLIQTQTVRRRLENPVSRRWLVILMGMLFVILIPERIILLQAAEKFYIIKDLPYPLIVAIAGDWFFSISLILGFCGLTCLGQGLAAFVKPIISTCLTIFLLMTMGHSLKKINQPPPNMLPLQNIIPRDAVVYWDREDYATWLLLKRSNYAGLPQNSGVMFSRTAAFSLAVRMGNLKAVGLLINRGWVLDPPDFLGFTADNPRSLCNDTSLDFLILQGVYNKADFVLPSPLDKEKHISVFQCKPATQD